MSLILIMKNLVVLLTLVITSATLSAQNSEIIAKGKITDSRTARGVKSNIRYSSIPTGSIFGRFSDSTFSFPIFGSSKYQITVEAKGYNAKTVIVDPKDIDDSNLLLETFISYQKARLSD